MRRTIANILGATLTIAAIAPAALAVEAGSAPEVRVPYNPHTLVSAAYNGRLPGISGFGDLEADVLARDVKAEDLIEAAISQGRLSPEYLEDRKFVNAVSANLRALISGE